MMKKKFFVAAGSSKEFTEEAKEKVIKELKKLM